MERPQVQAPCEANSSSGSSYHDQQALPVYLSNSALRTHGSEGFHGSSAFDPCCPVTFSQPAVIRHQAVAAPTQPLSIDGYGSIMVAQPQPQPPPQPSLSSCRHYMPPPCKYESRGQRTGIWKWAIVIPPWNYIDSSL